MRITEKMNYNCKKIKMKTLNTRALLLLLYIILTSCAKDKPLKIDEPIDFVPVSRIGIDKMAHTSSLYTDDYAKDGTMWAVYMASENDLFETIESDASTYLVKLNGKDKSVIERHKILSRGELVDNFQVSTKYSPYDPLAIVFKDFVRCYSVCANENDQEGLRYIYRDFNKKTKTFGEVKSVYFITDKAGTEQGTLMSNKTFFDFFSKNQALSNDGVKYLIMAGGLISYRGYYYTFLGAYPAGMSGAIVRSRNGIEWETVFPLPTVFGHIFEASFVIRDNKLILISRNDTRREYVIAKFNMTGSMETSRTITDCSPSRPRIFIHKNEIFTMYNGSETYLDKIQVTRNRVILEKININTLAAETSREILTNFSFQYYSTAFNNSNDKLYIMWTNGMQLNMPAQMKDAIVWKLFDYF
ncbi:hypothetical protein [Sphingobacterium corticibacter]|uniref:DUF4374 domain-containing protein n=1 Tax=Sphingobacterium corticibacter TaxID=2171749 RepID=A0A2T8HJW0_9SPHI|nr:hypothetical protein [Sphingobacterium corticibacter]PVH25602.1 hypothetical protein DC487_06575 [Sphingobacterium corticibacter]